MAFQHTPVLFAEVLHWMRPAPGQTLVDGTLGGGGHAEALLRAIQPGGRLYGIDRDAHALAAASGRLADMPGFTAVHGNFHELPELLAARDVRAVDGILLDLGVSSPQLDEAERGFSFHQDAPLDMRMDQSQELTAADIMDTWSAQEIAEILRDYGEEKWAVRIAAVIVEHRQRQPLRTTGDLVRAIDAAVPKKVRQKADGHPARRSFQALRIAVNDELSPLAQALTDAVALLRPGGRLCVISFHSLEDRIVKQTFRTLKNPCTCPPKAPICTCGKEPVVTLPAGAVRPGEAELAENPRARSATLRVAEKR